MREHNRLRGLRAPVLAKDTRAIGGSHEAHGKLLILAERSRHSLTDAAAAKMTSATALGFDSIATWLDSTAVILALAALAMAISRSGGIIRSCLATTYQLGLAE